jgi:hypothetical protein
VNLASGLGIDDGLKAKYVEFMRKQDQWMRSMIQSHPSSEHAFWMHVSYVIAQFDGLYAGYKAAAKPGWVSAFLTVALCCSGKLSEATLKMM